MFDARTLRQAARDLGHADPISIEPDGTIWLGIDPDRIYLTAAQLQAVNDKVQADIDAKAAALESARAKLAALGLTDAEVAALLRS